MHSIRLLKITNVQQIISRNWSWLWDVILFPFLVTRTCWIVIAYFIANNYISNPTYEKYFSRGFYLTKIFPVDIFARWDSAQYFSIIKYGYQPSIDISTTYSNIPFFPLFPYIVKSFGWLGISLPDGYYVAFGILLSNILFLSATILLYRLIIDHLKFSELIAKRSIYLLFAFPTSFVFSSFYPESLFLFLTIAGIFLAMRDHWGWAALITGLILLTKLQGLVIWGALFFLYFERKLLPRKIKWVEILGFCAAPLGLALHFGFLFTKTGDIIAPITAMSAWGRHTFLTTSGFQENLNGPGLDVFKIDLLVILIFFISSLLILKNWKYKAFGFLALLLCIMPISSGILVSISRYVLVIFPVFIFLGSILKNRYIFEFLLIILFSLQIIYFSGWVNYYWIA